MNPDAFCRFIGPKNLGKALIDDELASCLLDNGVQLNFITPAYAQERRMDIMFLDYLAQETGGSVPLIRGLGGISVEPIGFIMMNVKVPGVEGYDEDQIAIVMDDPGVTEWPVILGTPTGESDGCRAGLGCLILSGRLWSGPGLEWSSSSREGRVELHRGKPVLEFPMSSPQIFLLYSLTSGQDLASLGDAYAPHSPPSKVSRRS